MKFEATVLNAAEQTYDLLSRLEWKLALAESCTCGLVAGAMSQLPGVSAYLCGSMVVYRNETKSAYLNIEPELIDEHGPVSSEVATLMAANVLKATPEANVSASVTGHLGPGAPEDQDGLAYIGVSFRAERNAIASTLAGEFRMDKNHDRSDRQTQVVIAVLETLSSAIRARKDSN